MEYTLLLWCTPAPMVHPLHLWCTHCSTVAQVRTTQRSGLLLYAGALDASKDFLALELHQGFPRFVFDVGSGPRVIDRDSAPLAPSRPISDDQWHDVSVGRAALGRHVMRVDAWSARDLLPDSRSVYYDLPTDDLYLGGLPHGVLQVGSVPQGARQAGVLPQGALQPGDMPQVRKLPQGGGTFHPEGPLQTRAVSTLESPLQVGGLSHGLPQTKSLHPGAHEERSPPLAGVSTHLLKQLRSREGFQGCLGAVRLDDVDWRLTGSRVHVPEGASEDVREGCEGKQRKGARG